ncbi:MAG: tetratricopeptide repeat protein [Vicinamibacterales bacterium]
MSGRRSRARRAIAGPAPRAARAADGPATPAGAVPWSALAILLAVTFVLKLIVVLQLKDHPLTQPEVGLDTTAYADLARQVVAGNIGLGPGLYYVSPLYIYVMAAGLALTGSFTAIRVAQVLLGTLAVGAIFLTARIWFGTRAAWIAAGLAALTGLFTFYEVLLLQAAVDPFLTSVALLALAFGLAREDRRGLVLAGAMFGLQSLNRPNVLLAAAGLVVVLLALRRWRLSVLLAAGLLAGLAPVAVRNVVVAHEWSLVSSHGGLNLYIGNNEQATGFYQQVPGISPSIAGQSRDARRVAERATGRAMTDAETSDYFVGLARDWILGHPAQAARLFLKKLGLVFHAQYVALPYSFPFYAWDARTMLRFYAVGPWLLIPLGLVGLVVAAPRDRLPAYVAWAAFVPAYAAAVALFFVAERYRLPLLVPLCIGAGAAVDVGLRLWATRRQALAVPAVAAAALLVAANWPLGLRDGRWEEGLRMAQRLVILQRYDEADQWVARLEADHPPRPGAAYYGVGLQLLVGGQAERAVPLLTRGLEVDPGRPNTEYALGQALLQTGRTAEALPHLRRGFDGGTEIPMAGFDLASALIAQGDLPGATAVIPKIQPPDTGDPEPWLRVGRLAMEAQAPELATPFFQRAVQIRPDQAGARQQLGLNLLVRQQYDTAARELAEALRLDPRSADSAAHLAYCELQLGRYEQARLHSETALQIDPRHALAGQVRQALERIR